MTRAKEGLEIWPGDGVDGEASAPTRPLITRSELVRHSLILLDETGFDGLTMRRLAERLGVKAASIYNHVRNKDELLTLMADTICAEIVIPGPELSWRESLETVAHEYRRVLLARRDAARVLAVTPPVGPNRLRTIEQMLDVFCRAGFSNEQATDAAFVFNTYVVGFVLDESFGWSDGRVSAEETREWAKRWYNSLSPERYPRLHALSEYLFEPSLDHRFEFGLSILLDGLAKQLAESHSG